MRRRFVHDRHDVRGNVDHARPGLGKRDVRQRRQAPGQPFAHLPDRPGTCRRIDDPCLLERRLLVVTPARGREARQKAAAQAQVRLRP